MTPQIVSVAVADTNYGFDRVFDYKVPDGLNVHPGCRVLVPFGIGNRKRIALVLRFCEDSDERIKEIAEVIDPHPLITAEGLVLIDWLVSMTFCTYFDACRLFLPSNFNIKLKIRYKVNEETLAENPALLSESDLAAIDKIRKTGSADETDITYLLAGKLIYPEEYISGKREKSDEKIVTVTEEYKSGSFKYAFSSDKPRKAVQFLKTSPGISVKELQKLFDISTSSLKTLQKRHIIDISPAPAVYEPEKIKADFFDSHITLTDEQKRAYDGLEKLLESGKPSASLLFGVTGSGKTAVFSKLIERTVNSGKTAMLLVPEISLTPQLQTRFTEVFGEFVSVIHSGLSVSKRAEEQARIRAGMVKLVIGTRSAVFAPLSNIGLIIIDEEQERSFISEMTPRFDARVVAKKRCVYHNAALILASATPSVESYHYALTGRYNLFTINERYSKASMPFVDIVDMASDGYYGDSQNFGNTLTFEINRNLENHEQTILLLNRRGFNTVVTCRSCKQTIMCPHCSVSLTYHRHEKKLRCHWCGYVKDEVDSCPSCGGKYLQFIGSGTERIEKEISDLFPSARVLRLDADTITSRGAYEEKFSAFENQDFDIMLGTQMIAKGLNFPNVTLVGVVSTDSALYAGDYRSYERTFSLLTQVAGRGGRGDKPGRAVIQSFNPDHYILKLAAVQDYPEFFAQEIGNRKLLIYPPFCDLCVIEFTGTDDSKTSDAAAAFAAMIRERASAIINETNEKIPLVILGPARCIRERINNKFRYKLVIKCRWNGVFRRLMSECYRQTFSEQAFGKISVSIAMNGDASI
ncbi:MAG: primosomal protein N' [Ruminococcus sp.]|nr:primosomal protein N' [Ruminococcus sp.]